MDSTATVDTRPATFPTEEHAEKLLGPATGELMEIADPSILDEPETVVECLMMSDNHIRVVRGRL